MNKISTYCLTAIFIFLNAQTLFAFSLPSGFNELRIGVDDVTSVGSVQIQKYEIKINNTKSGTQAQL